MKKLMVMLVSLMFLLPSIGFSNPRGDWGTELQMMQCSHYESNSVSVTDTSSSVTFSKDTKAVYVENLGTTNEMYVNLNGSTATTGSNGEILLNAGKNRSVDGFTTSSVSVIASSGETTTALVEACW